MDLSTETGQVQETTGRTIAKWLHTRYPRSMAKATWLAWADELNRKEWNPNLAIEALAAHFRFKPSEFLPPLPVIEAVIAARHKQHEGRNGQPQDDGPAMDKATAARCVAAVYSQPGMRESSGAWTPRPGWNTSHFLALNSWRAKNSIAVGTTPQDRAQRDALSAELAALDAQKVAAISRAARAGITYKGEGQR